MGYERFFTATALLGIPVIALVALASRYTLVKTQPS
jgi:hypothetical protein